MKSRRSGARRSGALRMVPDMAQLMQAEIEEQFQAQIAAIACEVAFTAMKKGIISYIKSLRKKGKTIYEYNHEE